MIGNSLREEANEISHHTILLVVDVDKEINPETLTVSGFICIFALKLKGFIKLSP